MNGNDDFLRRMDRLLQEFQEILNDQKKQRRTTASRFGVFESFGVERSESVHSTFLKFLLNPTERHDQGDFFLSTFLEFFCLRFEEASTQRASVKSEADLRPFGRVDIRIRLTNGQIILIENKVDAAEGCNQIEGYLKWLEGQVPPAGFCHRLVFLTPDGRKPVSTTRPEDVVCVSYSKLADWITANRQQIEAPRLGVILDHYADTCRLIAEAMRRDAMPDSMRQFFLDPDEPGRLEAALELASHVESYRRELYERFCGNMVSELSRRLQSQGCDERWVVVPDDDVLDGSPFGNWKGWRITWRARQDQPHFSVKVEYWPKKGLFYGVTRGFDVNKAGAQHQRDADLQNRLRVAEFTKSTKYWPAYRFFGDVGLPRFDPSRTDDALEIHRELQTLDGLDGLTGRVVDLVWQLFDAFRQELEELNDPWLYRNVE